MGDTYRQEALAAANALRSLATTLEVSPAPRTAARMSTEWLPQTAGRLAALAQLAEAARWIAARDGGRPARPRTGRHLAAHLLRPAAAVPSPCHPTRHRCSFAPSKRPPDGAPDDVAAELSDLAERLRLAWTPEEWELRAPIAT